MDVRICADTHGYRTDVRGMYGGIYGGCTGDVRLDIVQIPYRYRTDITEPLPLGLRRLRVAAWALG